MVLIACLGDCFLYRDGCVVYKIIANFQLLNLVFGVLVEVCLIAMSVFFFNFSVEFSFSGINVIYDFNFVCF